MGSVETGVSQERTMVNTGTDSNRELSCPGGKQDDPLTLGWMGWVARMWL